MRELNGHVAGVEHPETNKAILTIIIDPETFEAGLKKIYDKNKGKMAIPGFRKGKAPRKFIEMQYGKDVFYDDAINEILPDAYAKSVDEHDLDIVSRPEINVVEAEAGKGVVITATCWTKPGAVIENYKGIKYNAANLDVTDEELNGIIDSERVKNSRLIAVEESRPLASGDVATIDYEGSVDGELFEGGKDEEAKLEIGQGRFIPGFEEQLIGMNTGEEREITVTFPETYHAEHLAGKEAKFKVHLHSIHIKEMPDLDDDFAASVSDFDTLEEYKADLKEKLAEDKKNNAEALKEESLAISLSEMVEVDVPGVMIESEINNMMDGFARNLGQRGIDPMMYLQYMGKTVNDLKNEYREGAVHNVRARLALEAIAITEGYTAGDDEIEEEIARLAELYDMEADKLKETMSERERKGIAVDLNVRKAMKLVVESAVADNSN